MLKRFNDAIGRFKDYIYDPSVNIKDRSFVLFSITVLFALFAALPCGLIMREPMSATIATLIGALFFSLYVWYEIRKKHIARAKIVITIILVFVFLPAMFFTNGGAGGGTPIWLLLGTIYITMILDGRLKYIMLAVNMLVLTDCWITGYLNPELIEEYSRGGIFFDSIAGLYIVGTIIFILISFQNNLNRKEEEYKNLQRLFAQTATSLVNAIDAKDKYTHGHSSRVAEYSKKIAQLSGMTPAECDEVYYCALLHDVGKIGIPEHIINKEGKLTPEEYEIVKQHPVLGSQILHGIKEYPKLSIGALYHHERYDGKGYPARLKGEDIPTIARIISVADAYDAMTSKRSYRASIPQQTVREEIVKGSGTQFDPEYAKIMQHLIDLDTEYLMKEQREQTELSGKNDLVCDEYRDEVSSGILLSPEVKHVRFRYRPTGKNTGTLPTLVLFDSSDGRYHDNEADKKELFYYEHAVLHFDGTYECKTARKVAVEEGLHSRASRSASRSDDCICTIEAVKRKDHALIVLDNGTDTFRFIVALEDSTRYVYLGLTGENCSLYDIDIYKDNVPVPVDYIPRIAEEISYINVPAGDIPNVQVDSYRTASTEGIPLTDGMKISFHAMSLPTARLIWHCAYILLFYSPDKRPEGKHLKEYALIRLDGENWESKGVADNKLYVNIDSDFEGWDKWKEIGKQGFDCTVTFRVQDNKVTTMTSNLGLDLRNVTTIYDPPKELYVSLTGDQCAITNIRIER
jgi:hypothetical protein